MDSPLVWNPLHLFFLLSLSCFWRSFICILLLDIFSFIIFSNFRDLAGRRLHEFIWVLQSKSMEHEDARDFNRPETQSRSCQELLVDLQTIFLSFSSYLLISMTQEISYLSFIWELKQVASQEISFTIHTCSWLVHLCLVFVFWVLSFGIQFIWKLHQIHFVFFVIVLGY